MTETTKTNHAAWIGPLIAMAGLVSYFVWAVHVPSLRDSALLNLLLVGVGVALSVWALVHRRNWKSWLGLVVAVLPAVLLVAYVFVLSNMLPKAETAARVGEIAPRLELPDHTGAMVSVDDFSGRRVLVVFYRGFW
jgi:hypothetical protein